MADISISIGVVVDDAGIDQINSKIANMAKGMSSDLGTAEISTKGLESAIGSMSKVVQDLDGTVGKLGGGMTNLGRKTNETERAVTRQVFAQRAALSSANNLTRSMTQLATGSGGAAASFGIVTRQLALLSTSAAGTGLTMNALWASFMGPAGIAIGISVAVTAITSFITAANNKKKAVNEVTNSLDKYINRLGLLDGVARQGVSDSQSQITSLKTMYAAVNDVSLSTDERTKAINRLRDAFPAYFKMLSDEEIMAGKGKVAYDELTKSIIATAKARAFEGRITDNAIKLIDKESEALQNQIELNKELNKVAAQEASGIKAEFGLYGEGAIRDNRAREAANKLSEKQKALQEEINTLNAENVTLTSRAIRAYGEVDSKFNQTTKTVKDQKIEIDALEGSLKKLQETRALLQEKLIKENDLEAQKAYTAQITALDAEILKVTNSLRALKIVSDLAFKGMTTTELLMEKSVNNALADLKAFHEELNKIRDKGSFNPFDLSGIKTSDQVRMDANKDAGEPFSATLWKNTKKGLEDANKTNLKGANELSKTLSRGFHSAGKDILGIVSTLNQIEEEADKKFYAIFNKIADGLNSSFNDLFLRIISDKIKNKLLGNITEAGENAGTSLNKGASKTLQAAAAMGLAGQMLSGIVPKTSSLGQGSAGALSGMGAGAAIGTALGGPIIGTIAGGVIGAISGLFGAKKARKEAKVQEQQLEEQRKQTELMERQNAMSFLQSIVGRMVDGVGVINNADISWDGKLVTEVSGRNLKFILEREESASKRGV